MNFDIPQFMGTGDCENEPFRGVLHKEVVSGRKGKVMCVCITCGAPCQSQHSCRAPDIVVHQLAARGEQDYTLLPN